MTQTGVTNAVVNTMLAWLKGLAAWVLRLFNLSGSGGSPLSFMANNWKVLLAILLIAGIAADILVWLIRWRPHWVWFHKKRIVINDDDFFKDEDEIDDRPRRKRSKEWVDREYVVPSTIVKRKQPARPKAPEKKEKEEEKPAHIDVFRDRRFDVNAKQRFTDRYESEVFDVKDLHRQGAHRNAPRDERAQHTGSQSTNRRPAPSEETSGNTPARRRRSAPRTEDKKRARPRT